MHLVRTGVVNFFFLLFFSCSFSAPVIEDLRDENERFVHCSGEDLCEEITAEQAAAMLQRAQEEGGDSDDDDDDWKNGDVGILKHEEKIGPATTETIEKKEKENDSDDDLKSSSASSTMQTKHSENFQNAGGESGDGKIIDEEDEEEEDEPGGEWGDSGFRNDNNDHDNDISQKKSTKDNHQSQDLFVKIVSPLVDATLEFGSNVTIEAIAGGPKLSIDQHILVCIVNNRIVGQFAPPNFSIIVPTREIITYQMEITVTLSDLDSHTSLAEDTRAYDLQENPIEEAYQYTVKAADYFKRGLTDEAMETLEEAMRINPKSPEAIHNYGFYKHLLKENDQAAIYMRRLASLGGYAEDVGISFLVQLCGTYCMWDNWDNDVRHYLQRLALKNAKNEAFVEPYLLFSLPVSPSVLRLQSDFIVQTSRNKTIRTADELINRSPSLDDSKGRLRVGYFNMGGFSGSHLSIGRFLQGFLAKHNESRIEVFCYSNSKTEDNGPVFDRCHCGSNYYFVSNMTANDTAALILSHRLHVLVETAGFSYSAFNRVPYQSIVFHSKGFDMLLRRVAPVQIEFHGYPGSHGNDSADLLAMDRISAPPEISVCGVAEKLLYLKSSYLVTEHSEIHRSVLDFSGEVVDRTSIGLPEDKFIFACFNRENKFYPDLFRRWIRILNSVPNSVLWLLKFEDDVEENIRKFIQKEGLAQDRLIMTTLFTRRAVEYSGKGNADLFLDTPPFTAHTTASDCLWSGVPLLTVAQESIASRVAASLVIASGTSVTIARTMDEYEEMAIRIGNNRKLAAELKQKFRNNRLSGQLWDLAAWTADWERLQRMSWEVSLHFPSRHFHVV